MEKSAPNPEVREALFELQQYLSDSLAPLMVQDSIKVLMQQPASLTGATINAWASSQYHGPGASVPVSDYLFHAMKKIYLMGEYELISKEPLEKFLTELARIVLGYCPGEDRELLRTNLSRLRESTTILSSSVDYLHRQTGSVERPLASTPPVERSGGGGFAGGGFSGAPSGGGGGGGIPLSSSDLARGLRSFTMLMERMQRQPMAASPATPGNESTREIFSQLLTLAASTSRSGAELDERVARLQGLGLGVEASMRDVFRELGESLPDWVRPETGVDPQFSFSSSSPLEAMHRLIALADDPAEGATRFREMVHAAIEQVNQGALARAATMLELAERIITEKKVHVLVVQAMKNRSHEGLQPEVLRKAAETPEKHHLLRKILNFFTPLTVENLLEDLQHEDKRDRRRLLLALLEAHGPETREAVHPILEASAQEAMDEQHRYYQRNLVYLLRRIPPPPEAPMEQEVGVITLLAQPEVPGFLAREAITHLGAIKIEASEKALVNLMGDFERILLRPKDSPYDLQEIRQSLDRTVAALARFGTITAAQAVVGHGLRKQAQLGDTMARLADLGGQDLSADPALVERLLKALRSELPLKVLGFVIQKKAENVFFILEALAATPSASVAQTLEEIVQKFPEHDFGRTAAKTLAGFGATPRPPEAAASVGLAGDLELFGLPNLLQTLAEATVSGMLTLNDSEGETSGLIVMEGGRLLDAQAGKLRGNEAIYQLFERPAPGTFSFIARREGALDKEKAAAAHEVIPIVFEAMRRYDEFRQARVLVPDHVTFEVSGMRPTSHPEEKDVNLWRMVWTKVRAGATALECEEGIPADSYRVRRLLVHWTQEGALQQI